jgi:crotonobetainyl-CoA:carnitine CoA-transferase CaiB-like acyl-CoA transferase
VAAIMDTNNIINQPVWNAKEVANHPHWNERGALRWLDDPTYGELLHQAPSFKMSATPARLKWALKPVGADNEYIFGKLAGLTPQDIKRLEDQECI